MSPSNSAAERRQATQTALADFACLPLPEAARALLRVYNPHRAHLDILASLTLENLGEKRRPSNFRELYDDWIGTLSTQKLNADFYKNPPG